MADTDAEKAEKLAAARKRFEELKRKKQPNKKASSSTTPHEPTSSTSILAQASHQDTSPAAESEGFDKSQQNSPRDGGDTIKDKAAERFDEAENGRREFHSATSEVLLESLPEIYRKQASVIDELRSDKQQLLDEIKALHIRAQEGSKAMVDRDKALEDLASVSEELQMIKEKSGAEQAELLEGVGEASALRIEVASLNRQITHIQSQMAQKDKAIVEMRRDSTLSSPGPDEAIKQEERMESMSVELSESRAALETSALSVNNLTLERDRLEALVDSMRVELETATNNADDLNDRLNKLTESVSSGNAKSSAWEERSSAQEQTIAELNQKLDGMKSTVDQLKQSNQELRASERDMETRYRDIERRLANAQRENSGMQLRLAELKSSLHESFAKADPFSKTDSLEATPPKGGVDNKEAIGSSQFQDNTDSKSLGSADDLWRQVLADENSNDFLDIDLKAVSRNPVRDQGVVKRAHVASQKDRERRLLTQRVRKELESWRGHRIDLVDVYRAYDDLYSRVFDI
ncbi:hypothetical protein TWF481_005773 [Arthrobotrys musiformis]|uniref:Uncharacterized protein n=1 Tax=Arthrobotrys musiformis TaxID=47236 RepID=A0AAV9WEQ0_9PEZI